MRVVLVFPLTVFALAAQTHSLTLRQAVDKALAQNPDLALARLDEQKAAQEVRVAKDPFVPKVVAGSGLAYTSGFPMSIEGSAPSVVQASAIATIINRPVSYRLAQARENERGAQIDTLAKRDEVVYRVTDLFFEAARLRQSAETVRRQLGSLERIDASVRARVEEGRELPIEARKTALKLLQHRQRVETLEFEAGRAESLLAVMLGWEAGDRVQAVQDEQRLPAAAVSEEEAVASALAASKAIRRLESAILAKSLDVRANKAERLPTVDLVAQYGLFAKFNKFEDYFNTFQRHNGQLGVAIRIPLVSGSAAAARAAQAQADMTRLRLEMNSTRNRLTLECRRAWQDLAAAKTASEVARFDLELAREQVSVLLAQVEEGRAGIRQVEEARIAENEKWLAFLDARHAAERAQFGLLRLTGGLIAALR